MTGKTAKTRTILVTVLGLAAFSLSCGGSRPSDHVSDEPGPASSASSTPPPRGAWADVLNDYEAIRAALATNTTSGIASHATAIAETAGGLAEDFDAQDAGIAEDRAASVQAALPQVKASAETLAQAADVKSARAAFADLTTAVRPWREAADRAGLALAYCPMVKQHWLQRGVQPISNPFDHTMPKCGVFVKDEPATTSN